MWNQEQWGGFLIHPHPDYFSVVRGHYLEISKNTYLHTWKVEKRCS